MAKLIVIEGPDRCGKATQTKMLKDHLQSIGYKVVTVEVPVEDGHTYRAIYWMLANGMAKLFPKLFQKMHVLNRQIFQATTLKRYDEECDFVIFDRWSLSTKIYGLALGLDEKFVDRLYQKSRKPDHTILLLGNSHRKISEDVYEADIELQKRVNSLYAGWALENINECSVIDCAQQKESVFYQIKSVLETKGFFS